MGQPSKWRRRLGRRTCSCLASPWNKSRTAAPGIVRSGTTRTSHKLERRSTLFSLTTYCQAHEQLGALYADPGAWTRKAILNVASSGKFSSDRTIAEYAADIWHVKSHPVA